MVLHFYGTFPVCWPLKALYNNIHPFTHTFMVVEAAMQDTNCSWGAMWGSVSCSQDTSTCSWGEPGFKPVTFQSLDDPLYLLSYSHKKHYYILGTLSAIKLALGPLVYINL